jgi:HlyD family secretion protein
VDRKIEKKLWTPQRILTVLGGLSIIGLLVFVYLQTTGKSRLNVNSERIAISEVTKGSFQETIPINGVVLPMTSIYLDAIEGGRVEELYVEDGAVLKKNQPILKLSNTDLELSLANQETSVFDLISNMNYTRNLARQTTIQQQNNLADAENAFIEAKRVYDLNRRLHDQKVIADQDFKSSQNLYAYQQRRLKLIRETLLQDSIITTEQLNQMRASIQRTQITLGLMRKKAEDLVVKAPLDGQLTSLNAEIGEQKNRGQRLGQLDVLSGFKVRADIDEHYIARIYTGLSGEFTLNDKTYKLRIKKVYTQVTNGRFQVDMEFVGAPPQGIRRGQTLQIRLALSDETQALLLPKGGFYQQTGGNWIFKLNEDGSKAYRIDIQLGRQNPDYYEIMSGLKPGDKVVTSSYDTYGDMQELVLKENKNNP